MPPCSCQDITILIVRHSRALGASPDGALAVETLDYAMEKARDQDFIYYFSTIGANTKTRRIAGDYFKKHYDTVRCMINFSE
jgi:hypothetical protein